MKLNKYGGNIMERINELIAKYGTPLYLYDKDKIEQQYDILKDSILKGANIYYSIKANPLMGIVKVLYQKGSGIELASKGEMYAAIKAGCDPKKMVFAGPGKTFDDIAFAIDNGIKAINAECLEEIRLINEYSEEKEVVTDIALRINPTHTNKGAILKMTGVASQFGIDESKVDEDLIQKIFSLKYVNLIGLHVYMGTQILDANEICENTECIIELGLKLKNNFGVDLKYIDFGGGFGVNYFKGEKPLDTDVMKAGMHKLSEQYKEQLSGIELIFECGRFLVAESGVFVTEVQYTKESRGERFVVCDGGSNLHAASAFLGRFMRNNYPIISIPSSDMTEEMDIVGPCCTPTDLIGKKVKLNKDIKAGDYIVIQMSGAYGLSDSPLLFLSHEWPLELLYNDEYEEVIRKRGTAEDLLLGQV